MRLRCYARGLIFSAQSIGISGGNMATPRWAHTVSQAVKDNSTSILSGAAIAGVVGTAVLAVRATPKAVAELAVLEMDKQDAIGRDRHTPEHAREAKLTPKEIVQATWKFYVPAALSAAGTIACIVWSNAIGIRRNVALFSAYTLVDTAFREYKDKVIEQIGPNKEHKVVDEIHKERLQQNPVSSSQVIITGLGEQLCYDTLTGRYFKSDIETIRRAWNSINATVLHEMYASHNEFYALIGLPPTTIGEELGWNIDNLMELVFSSHLNECDQPCLAMGYAKLPIAGYDKF